jgi:nucleotide-binding universal stress UspA family protein
MTQKLLVPIDGSEHSLRALDHALGMVKDGLAAELHLVNVQPPVGGTVATFVAAEQINDYHREEAMKALQPALDRAAAAGAKAAHHIGVGAPPAGVIVRFCQDLGCDQIVMGARGLGAAASLLLGSASRGVIERATAPVTIVK